MTKQDALDAILLDRHKQDKKSGKLDSATGNLICHSLRMSVTTGKVCEAVNDGDFKRLRKSLVSLAAMSIRALEGLHRTPFDEPTEFERAEADHLVAVLIDS